MTLHSTIMQDFLFGAHPTLLPLSIPTLPTLSRRFLVCRLLSELPTLSSQSTLRLPSREENVFLVVPTSGTSERVSSRSPPTLVPPDLSTSHRLLPRLSIPPRSNPPRDILVGFLRLKSTSHSPSVPSRVRPLSTMDQTVCSRGPTEGTSVPGVERVI